MMLKSRKKLRIHFIEKHKWRISQPRSPRPVEWKQANPESSEREKDAGESKGVCANVEAETHSDVAAETLDDSETLENTVEPKIAQEKSLEPRSNSEEKNTKNLSGIPRKTDYSHKVLVENLIATNSLFNGLAKKPGVKPSILKVATQRFVPFVLKSEGDEVRLVEDEHTYFKNSRRRKERLERKKQTRE